MQSWKLEIEYDGTRYSGWQKQQNARTIQNEISKAAEEFLNTRVDIGGAGRTDSGVHALGQVAHMKIKSPIRSISAKQLHYGINDLLPYDINILNLKPAPTNFHARHDAISRYYIYQISTKRTAFGKPYVWWVKDKLNIKEMDRVCPLIVGRHDYSSFCEENQAQSSTIVNVEFCQLFTAGGLILIRIGASHFLWKMVRRIVGTLVEIGRGNLTIGDFEKFLEQKSNGPAAWTAPPSGLFLERVLYSGDKPQTTKIAPSLLQ
jgi:tRNA pseudouridine38-40 synthase